MSYIDCIRKSSISAEKKAEAEAAYRSRFDQYTAGGMTKEAADAAAASDAADFLERAVAARRRRTLRTIQTQRDLNARLEGYQSGKRKDIEYANAALAIFERDPFSKEFDLEFRAKRIRGRAHALAEQFLNENKPNIAGIRKNPASMDNFVRELFGEKSGDAGSGQVSKGVAESLEYLRTRANAAGADIAKKDRYGMPQRHDQVRVAKAGKDAWVADVFEDLDWERMVDPETGTQVPLLQRQAVLERVYDTIKTDGRIKAKGGGMVRRAPDRRLGDHRFLEFKDADAWLRYQKKYGVGTPFDVIVGHIDHMSREIALMEAFGPNYNLGKEYVKNLVVTKAAELDVAAKGPAKMLHTQAVQRKMRLFDETFDVFTNRYTASPDDKVAYTFAGIRNLLTSARLGSAFLSALPGDFINKAHAKLFNRLPGAADVKTIAKMYNPASAADRKLAARSGLIMEAATSLAYGQERFVGEVMGPGFTRWISDAVLRLSLLTPHTQAAKWAFGMEVMGAFADAAKKSMDALPFAESMRNFGITAKDWEILRATPIYDHKGSKFLRPDDLLSRNDIDPATAARVADKFMEYILYETNFAVPSSSLRGRVFLRGAARPGTIPGELSASLAMWKNFPSTIMFMHMRRGLAMKKPGQAVAYLTSLGIGMTLAGAMRVQLNQLATGQDLMDMNPMNEEGRRFWAMAALYGGGMGIWGDFLFQERNRFGGGAETTLAGPVAGLIGDVLDLTVGNVIQAASGEDMNIGSEAVQFVNRNIPGGNIWWLRGALQREVFDQLQLQIDPRAPDRFRRMERNALREKGTEYFWPPGASVLQGDEIRAPDLGGAWQD
jgi:hypothetical protein